MGRTLTSLYSTVKAVCICLGRENSRAFILCKGFSFMEQQKPTYHSLPYSLECSTQLLMKFSFGEHCCSQPYVNKGTTLAMSKKSTAHILVGLKLLSWLSFCGLISPSHVWVTRVICQNSIISNNNTEYQTTLKQCYCYFQ